MFVTLTIGLLVLSAITNALPTTYAEASHTNNTHQTTTTGFGNNATESGRDKKVEKYLVPLLVGFKLTSLVSATFTALKIFIVQSLVVSKIALLGATLLAMKAIYEHMRHKFSHAKVVGWEDHHHYKPSWEWYPYPYSDDWSASFDSHPSPVTDLHSLASEPDRTTLPHTHGNNTFSVRSDIGSVRLVPKTGLVGYGTVITRITETTSDD